MNSHDSSLSQKRDTFSKSSIEQPRHLISLERLNSREPELYISIQPTMSILLDRPMCWFRQHLTTAYDCSGLMSRLYRASKRSDVSRCRHTKDLAIQNRVCCHRVLAMRLSMHASMISAGGNTCEVLEKA